MHPEVQVLSVALVGGVAAVAASRALRLPAIIPLLILGITLGPQGIGLMPRPDEVLGRSMNALVAIGVAVILFEGGLSLNLNQLRLAPLAVRNLVSIGAALSFSGATLCAHYIAGVTWSVAFLYGSLMIVTGPTVIMPLLKNVRVVPRVHTVLLWEGILIDAVGAITAVVTLEVVLENSGVLHAGSSFIGALVIGPALGGVCGYGMARILKYRHAVYAEEELDRLLALAAAVGIYAGSEYLFKESGLGAVTCAGLVMATVMHQEVEELRRFKGTLTTLVVAMLFMLLAANFDIHQLIGLWPWGFAAILGLMLIVRPISVLLCTANSKLNTREKIFISWIGPRGIVAASVASLFSVILAEHGQKEAGDALLALTFGTILTTVLLNGGTAWVLAWLLGIQAKSSSGVLIIGANELAQQVAALIELQGFPVLLVDTNPDLCERARSRGIRTANCSALDAERIAQADIAGIGALLALTSSSAVNVNACRRTAKQLNLTTCLSIVTPTTTPGEVQVLTAVGAGRAFAGCIDLGRLYEVIRSGKTSVHSIKVSPKIAVPEGNAFLPILTVNRDGVHPYLFPAAPPDGSTVIGLLLAPEVTAPFEPPLPAWTQDARPTAKHPSPVIDKTLDPNRA